LPDDIEKYDIKTGSRPYVCPFTKADFQALFEDQNNKQVRDYRDVRIKTFHVLNATSTHHTIKQVRVAVSLETESWIQKVLDQYTPRTERAKYLLQELVHNGYFPPDIYFKYAVGGYNKYFQTRCAACDVKTTNCHGISFVDCPQGLLGTVIGKVVLCRACSEFREDYKHNLGSYDVNKYIVQDICQATGKSYPITLEENFVRESNNLKGHYYSHDFAIRELGLGGGNVLVQLDCTEEGCKNSRTINCLQADNYKNKELSNNICSSCALKYGKTMENLFYNNFELEGIKFFVETSIDENKLVCSQLFATSKDVDPIVTVTGNNLSSIILDIHDMAGQWIRENTYKQKELI
jgi:hypothetical protein